MCVCYYPLSLVITRVYLCSKTAVLEGLEVDQYIWGIITNSASAPVDEVTMDPTASWRVIGGSSSAPG